MPVLLREGGFIVYIFGNDHAPKQVHVYRGSFSGPEMIINLLDFSIRSSYMKANDARRALKVVEENQSFFISEWDRIVGTD